MKDDGIGIPGAGYQFAGKWTERDSRRLEFVNGSLKIEAGNGTTLITGFRLPLNK